MKYKVNEIFYSLQAEGTYAGIPAVFVRLSGCNLKCPWCDTKTHTEGTWYTKEELEIEVNKLTNENTKIMIVFTGGEPTLQLKEDEELLQNYYRTIETNGTNKVPSWINWITCSPKTDITEFPFKPNEIKVVFEEHRIDYYKKLISIAFQKKFNLFMQPLELEGKMNIEPTVNFIKENPDYRLSLQFHKMIGVR